MRIKLDKGAIAPTRAHETDAGLDLYAREDGFIPNLSSANFYTGVHIELPKGCCGLLVSKSGLNVKHGITSTGLIDEGYCGEIVVKLFNHGNIDYTVKRGDKISQLVVLPVRYEGVEIVEEISGGARGENGFGSSGK